MCHATKWSKMSHVYVYDGEGHVRQTNKIHCTFPRHALAEKCVTQWNCVSPSALFLAVICKFKSYFRYKYGSLLKYNTKEYPFRMKCIYTFLWAIDASDRSLFFILFALRLKKQQSVMLSVTGNPNPSVARLYICTRTWIKMTVRSVKFYHKSHWIFFLKRTFPQALVFKDWWLFFCIHMWYGMIR